MERRAGKKIKIKPLFPHFSKVSSDFQSGGEKKKI
jgi:hypothetical protein